MSSQSLAMIVDFLNLENVRDVDTIKKFLVGSSLCDGELFLAEKSDPKYFGLATREAAIKDPNHTLNWYTTEPPKSLLGRPDVIFLDDVDSETGLSGEQRFIELFSEVVLWFQRFMATCEAGQMDVATLNRFKSTKSLVFVFEPSSNKLNPSLKVIAQNEPFDERIEVRILNKFIYPIIFSNAGKELLKIKRCRYCRRYFLGKRLSATFCSDTCRGGFHYANRQL